ncbi:MAG: hypothetical protein K5898_06750 [Ruminococcus sp.]|uniref:hypothetical protein n=1 Tax=Ruminococcus sp. TaxID=41978 RepID=UPI0025CD0969|nr:hypothetical protein [Ruminococcus sp.]MCR4794854.1 hypothetical protein [Ruminococcus sp.]
MASRKNRIVSLIVFLIFSFVILSSVIFIIINSDHKCCGEDCCICIEIAECLGSLQAHGNADTGNTRILLLLISVILSVNTVIEAHSKHTTLVSLKVEFLN